MRTLLIDNYDSYTFNLYQMIAEITGVVPMVVRNDEATWEVLKDLPFDAVVISPGPGRPERTGDFGCSREALLQAEVPVLGVCLGHQGLGVLYGAEVVHAPEVMHGRLSAVYHDGSELFREVPQGFQVVRYHSLMVRDALPDVLQKTAWTQDGVIMGLKHRDKPLWGVQFHPESICTEFGKQVVANFFAAAEAFWQGERRGDAPILYEGAGSVFENEGDAPPATFQVKYRKLGSFYDPETMFVNLYGQKEHAFWLDSSLETEASRFSFMGTNDGPLAHLVSYDVSQKRVDVVRYGRGSSDGVRCHSNQEQQVQPLEQQNEHDEKQERHKKHGHYKESIFDYLERNVTGMTVEADLPFSFTGGFVGYLGYELKADCGGDNKHKANHPDAMFLFADRFVAFDVVEKQVYLVALESQETTHLTEAWFEEMEALLRHLPTLEPIKNGSLHPQLHAKLHHSYDEHHRDIERIKQLLTDGETYEVNLTNEIAITTAFDPIALYRTLRRVNPAPYAAYLRFGELSILCSSPERFVTIDAQGRVEAKPIKGTTPRGRTPEEDLHFQETLRVSEKDRAENLMIVDLLRNDLGRVCEIGSVSVPKLMDVESYRTVHQLVSTIRGTLRSDLSAVGCVRAAFPGGSMTGAPKIRTMQIIDDIEGRARGVYSGAIGYFSVNGAADFNIVIRTIVSCRERLTIGVGGAVVSQSDSDGEYEEMLLKAQALLKAIAETQGNSVEHMQIIGDRKATVAAEKQELREN